MGICSNCGGSRIVVVWKRCPTCNGSGSINGHYCTHYGCSAGLIAHNEPCKPCGGTGKTK